MSFLFLTAARRRTPPHAPDLCFSAAGRAPGQCGPACHAPQKLAEFRPKDVSNVRRTLETDSVLEPKFQDVFSFLLEPGKKQRLKSFKAKASAYPPERHSVTTRSRRSRKAQPFGCGTCPTDGFSNATWATSRRVCQG